MQRLEGEPQLVSSNSFRVEHRPDVTAPEMHDDIISYLGEFRFQVQKYDYNLSLSRQGDRWRLGDTYRGEPMTTKAHRAMMERIAWGEPTHREEAEFTGLTFLEQQLADAQTGDSIIWFSPPGPKSQGYGDYGFGFEGRVISENEDKKSIRMTANRFERPTLEQFNEVFRHLVGSGFNGQHADDFLRMPVVIKGGLSNEFIELVFANSFEFDYDPNERVRFDAVIKHRIRPLINEYMHSQKDMSISDRIKSIHAMENIVTEARRNLSSEIVLLERKVLTLADARAQYGHQPEKVEGSCPVKSNNPLSLEGGSGGLSAILLKLPEDQHGAREVYCKACRKYSIRPQGRLLDRCQTEKCPDPTYIACGPKAMVA
ncbi:MAG: hypothetical protein ACD_37C00538G0002 [uncultured bacterium]|nr:MAG: hypothetical protein ACD_37C00538G0002 [uncultured bacterium]